MGGGAPSDARGHHPRVHRRRITWENGPEGLTVALGDVVYLTHSFLDGGQTWRCREIVSPFLVDLGHDTGAVTGDWLVLRLPEGTLHTTQLTGADRGSARVSLAQRLPDEMAPAIDVLWRLYRTADQPATVRIVALEPTAESRVRLEAIDEVQAYHDAATSDLSVPLPPPRRLLPRVLAGQITEQPVRACRGEVTQLTLSVETAGPWDGALVSVDGAHVGTLGPTETQLAWIIAAPPGTQITIAVAPFGTGAPAW